MVHHYAVRGEGRDRAPVGAGRRGVDLLAVFEVELAAVVGPYTGYARNADAHKRVMRKHQAANDAVRTMHIADEQVHKLATKAWADVIKLGESNGFRNAQASVLAPTGTIGFMMDCDTTGIEPDFSLVKFKKLVGGGSMQIVNQTVPRALRKLGYQEEQVEAIVEYIAEHGHVIDAPGLKTEHYEVFDCAMGERALTPMGHVRMMAACQPYISGAISKTVNLPKTATVEDIEDIHLQAWKLGLKALAVYRDECKVGQPLSSGKGENKGGEKEVVKETVVEYRPTRKRLPKSRPSRTTSFSVGGAEGYMTSGSYPDDGLGEAVAGVVDAARCGAGRDLAALGLPRQGAAAGAPGRGIHRRGRGGVRVSPHACPSRERRPSCVG